MMSPCEQEGFPAFPRSALDNLNMPTNFTSTTQILAFDIYGTLLNTNSINSTLQAQFSLDEETASQISLSWRKYQLEYTWRLNSTKVYQPFDVVTKNSLSHALDEFEVHTDNKAVSAVMEAYNHLSPFDDALPALQALCKLPNVRILVFSNGTEIMVNTALQAAEIASLVPDIFVADNVRMYKPAKEIYEGLLSYVNSDGNNKSNGQSVSKEQIWLVSGNPFDVTGARSAGLNAIWVDRADKGWKDRADEYKPSKVVNGLLEIVDLMEKNE